MADHPWHVQTDDDVRCSHVRYVARPRRPPLAFAATPPHEPPTPSSSSLVQPEANAPRPMSSAAGKQQGYRGVRCRSGKWVSEIREPLKTNRIWLGTYPTAEMAAVAYDVAAHALRGADAFLNFPDEISSRPAPASSSPNAIRSAAVEAAAMLLAKPEAAGDMAAGVASLPDSEGQSSSSAQLQEREYIDEEEIFDMPQLLVNMAEGMLVSPPRLSPQDTDDSPEASEGDSLWSYP